MSKASESNSPLFYRPGDGVAADFIPFYWEGSYHLFYLKDYRNPGSHGEGTPWFHLVTKDFLQFEDWGEALPRGGVEDQDLYVFTGCVFAETLNLDKPKFHIFYTGHNPHFQEKGKPIQAVMHAVSSNLRTWEKDSDFLFFSPITQGYEPDDWRDPFVFWNPDMEEYWMLLAARWQTGPARYRGLTAASASKDLVNWEVRQPFWSPDLYFTHECPDLFKMNDWYYLVYSTFSERCVTHYRMSRDLNGPWIAPLNDTFDSRAFYAAKTASDGQSRYIFGWLPTRTGENDEGDWNWGGDLVVHEIVQSEDGTLNVRMPDTIKNAFKEPFPLNHQPILGEWKISENRLQAKSIGRFSTVLSGRLPDECLVEASLRFSPETVSAGLLLRTNSELEPHYQVRIEPGAKRMVIDRWPRPGDQPFMLERPLPQLSGGMVNMRLLISGSCLVVYADEQVALSCRLYDHAKGELGFFIAEGEAEFLNLTVKTR
jgi:beta-fructofuranosidase